MPKEKSRIFINSKNTTTRVQKKNFFFLNRECKELSNYISNFCYIKIVAVKKKKKSGTKMVSSQNASIDDGSHSAGYMSDIHISTCFTTDSANKEQLVIYLIKVG